MRRDPSGLLFLLLIAGVLGYCYWRKQETPSKLTAADSKWVTFKVSASSPTTVRVHVRRTGHGATQVTIPVGTRYIASNASFQDVMTTRTVVVQFRGGETEQVVDVEVYCLDRFRDRPNDGLDYIVDTDKPEGPAAELAACIESKHGTADYDGRQMAIWVVKHELLHKTRDDVKVLFRSRLGFEAEKKLDEVLVDVEQQLVAEGMSMEEAKEQMAIYRENKRHTVLDEIVADELAKDWGRAKSLLASCGVDVENTAFFASR